MDNKLKSFINKLSNKDREVLTIATNSIYFNDSSDYRTALWEIINFLSNERIEECDSELFELLNEE